VNTDDVLADQFETHRASLRAVAYRLLGSVDEADDAVQGPGTTLSQVRRLCPR
jgi:RNA polymerase sigma-70 factor (ECF subfamily)